MAIRRGAGCTAVPLGNRRDIHINDPLSTRVPVFQSSRYTRIIPTSNRQKRQSVTKNCGDAFFLWILNFIS